MPIKDKQKDAEYHRLRYQRLKSNPEFKRKALDAGKRWYYKHKESEKERHRKWNKEHPELRKNYSAIDKFVAHIMVLYHYSHGTMACANPYNLHKEQFVHIISNTLDHIKDNGNEERRNLKGNTNLDYFLIKNNYPEGYQVLCMNCQFIKRCLNKRHRWLTLKEEITIKLRRKGIELDLTF